MARSRQPRAALLAVILSCVACQPQPQVQTEEPVPAQKPAKQNGTQITPTNKVEPQQFGFNVVSVEKEWCCSDVPGKPVQTPNVAVEGLTHDDSRFVLSCSNFGRVVTTKSGSRFKRNTRDEWYELHTASLGHESYGEVMTIYIFEGEPLDWKEFATCTVINRIERAKDVAPVRVTSSDFREWKDGTGYELKAWSTREFYSLRCLEGGQSPCVSVAPANYRGVRDGSELRLCDQELNLICTYRIVGERAFR